MSQTLLTYSRSRFDESKLWIPLTLGIVLGLSGCASTQSQDASSSLFSMPTMASLANGPNFRKAVYAGGSLGQSSLQTDTSGTVYTAANDKATASQFRLGIDLHNNLSVEVDTAILGSVDLVSSNNDPIEKDISYSTAAVNALFYGLGKRSSRNLREGFNPYGKVGYGIVQNGSIVKPFDKTNNKFLIGFGLEYGFQDGLAIRADATRVDDQTTFFGLGAVYRFGKPPRKAPPVFVNADGSGVDAASAALQQQEAGMSPLKSMQAMAAKLWRPIVDTNTRPNIIDTDGDGVADADDECFDTAQNTTTNAKGCGLFDAVLSEVTFKPGSAWLTPRARGELDTLSQTILAFPEARIQVRAHTDNEGPADANLGLSALRAESVVAYLIEMGVRELQLTTQGLGESQPIDTNDTEEGRKRNRRVELLTLPNIDEQIMADNEAILTASLIESEKTAVAKKTSSNPSAPWHADPVFPPMTGIKIEPLPKPAKFAGLELGGVLSNVAFNEGTAELTPESDSALVFVVEQMQMFPEARLVVMAHTDNSLSEQESKSLSVDRAAMVVDYLEMYGLEPDRLSAEGYGSSLPLAQNLTETDRKRNQRIELRVIK